MSTQFPVKSVMSCNECGDRKIPSPVCNRVNCVSRLLVAELIRDYPLIGDMQTPHQTLAVQALRNTRCVEEIAHGRSSSLGPSRSSNRT